MGIEKLLKRMQASQNRLANIKADISGYANTYVECGYDPIKNMYSYKKRKDRLKDTLTSYRSLFTRPYRGIASFCGRIKTIYEILKPQKTEPEEGFYHMYSRMFT